MRFHEMTAPEIAEVPRDDSLVLVPIAACEQHSKHLATFTDTILVTAVAEGVEEHLNQQVLLTPTLWLGASSHHLRFGGTLSAEVDTHISILCDLIQPILNDGFERLMILNGHGGNVDTMQAALRMLQTEYYDRQLSAASYWALAKEELGALATGPKKEMGHACEFETAMMMAVRPDLVREDLRKDDPPKEETTLRGLYLAEDMKQRTREGAVGYPEKATAEMGRKFLDAAIRRTTEVVKALVEKPLPS